MALDPSPNENGEYELNVKVENEDDKIKIGESAKITVDKTLEKDVLIVPSEAIVTSEEEDFVYIVEDDKAKQIKVDIVESQTKETANKDEIKAEENRIICKYDKITVDKTIEKDVLIVPSEEIVTSKEEDFVYIVEDDKAKQIKVDIVESQTKETAIKGEIKAEDNVVINGQSLLSDDVEVDVTKDGDES